MSDKKQKTTFQKITNIVSWAMLIIILGSALLAGFTSIIN